LSHNGSGHNESFCIGTGRAASINELYRILADLTGFEAPITRAAKRQGDIYKTFFDSNKAERILAWKPAVTFEAGVKATLDYLRP
jgi:UDP-glucose 4-epimerase